MPIPLGILAVAGAGGGAAGAYEQITTQVLSSTTSTITFSSIASTYKHLELRIVARTNGAGTEDGIRITFNGSTTGYSRHSLYGDGSSVYSGANTSQSYADTYPAAIASANTTNEFGSLLVSVLDYASTSKNKTIRTLGGHTNPSAKAISLVSNLWASTSAVSSISLVSSFGNSFVSGSRFSLYGIRG
jgi:hypothetical protein